MFLLLVFIFSVKERRNEVNCAQFGSVKFTSLAVTKSVLSQNGGEKTLNLVLGKT